MSSTRLKMVLLIGSLVALSACGGGSSSSVGLSFPVNEALTAFYQSSAVYNLTATNGSTTYHLQAAFTPGPQTTFIGTKVNSTVLVDSIESNGSVIVTGGKTVLYLGSPFREWGGILASGVYEVDHDQHVIPSMVSTGASGSLDEQEYFSDSSLNNEVGTGARTWTMAAASADTGLFCIDDSDDLGGASETEEDCYVMDEKGNILGLQITLVLNGTALTFK